MKLSSLDKLTGIKKKFPKNRKSLRAEAPQAQPTGPAQSSSQSCEEEDIFAAAMAGVQPLAGRLKGREVHVSPSPQASQGLDAVGGDEHAWVTEYLRNLVQGETEFELSYSEEFIHGYIQGLDLRVIEKLKAGRFSVEAHLDMHGLNAQQAKDAACAFLREQYHLGRRCVLLIPGRGLNSPGGHALIREELPTWLTRDPFRRVVLAFCTALPRHGGAGALYVLLRKFRKGAGKVRWTLPASME